MVGLILQLLLDRFVITAFQHLEPYRVLLSMVVGVGLVMLVVLQVVVLLNPTQQELMASAVQLIKQKVADLSLPLLQQICALLATHQQ